MQNCLNPLTCLTSMAVGRSMKCVCDRAHSLSLSLSPGDGSRSPASQKEFVELCRVVNNASPLFPGNFATALELFDMCVSVVPIFACARASPWLPPRPHRRPTRPRVALASNDDGLIDFKQDHLHFAKELDFLGAVALLIDLEEPLQKSSR